MSEVPVTYFLLCLAQNTCVIGTLDMSQAPLRHKWNPAYRVPHREMETKGTQLQACAQKVLWIIYFAVHM